MTITISFGPKTFGRSASAAFTSIRYPSDPHHPFLLALQNALLYDYAVAISHRL